MAMAMVEATLGADLRAAIGALERDAASLCHFETPTVRVVQTFSRPFSEIARVDVQAKNGQASLFVKVTRPKKEGAAERERLANRVRQDYRVTELLHAQMPVADGLSVVRPVACYPEHLALVTLEARGTTLMRLLESAAQWWPSTPTLRQLDRVFERLGAWLLAFQRIPAESGNDQLTIDKLHEYIDSRLERLVRRKNVRFAATDRAAVLAALDARIARVVPGDRRTVRIHGDMALGNILAEGSTITLLDLAMTGIGTRYHDVTQIHMQLELLRFKPQFRRSVVTRLQQSLLTDFGGESVGRDPLFQVMQAIHTATHCLSLAEQHGSLPERMYNRRIIRRHLRWLRRFADMSEAGR